MHSCSECMNKECQSRGNISGRGHCYHFIAPQNVVKEEVVFARKTNDSLRGEIKELEKQNKKLIKNTIVLLDALCSEDGCQDFKYCGKAKESKCSEISDTEKLLKEILKQS